MHKHEAREETSDEIDTVAADWVALVDGGPLDPQKARELERWLAADSRHRAAYAYAQSVFAYLAVDEAHAPSKAAAINSFFVAATAKNISRRRLLWAGGGAGLALAASISAFFLSSSVPAVTYTAQRGEIRQIPLPDGTVVTLDTASTIAVRYHERSRDVELLSGRALFDVAKDKTRPFNVTANQLKVRAVGTSFVVRNMDDQAPQVLVREGIVDVRPPMQSSPIRVVANMRLVLSKATSGVNVMPVDARELSHELAWQQGVFEIENVSLGTLAEEYARYSDLRIVIADPKIAAIPITGRFFANNPLGFARAASASFGLKVETSGQEIRLLNP